MKKVIEYKELKTVNLEDIDKNKIYAFSSSNGINKIQQTDANVWKAVRMDNSKEYWGKEKGSIKECVERFIEKGYIVYEFENVDDFFDNAKKMEI